MTLINQCSISEANLLVQLGWQSKLFQLKRPCTNNKKGCTRQPFSMGFSWIGLLLFYDDFNVNVDAFNQVYRSLIGTKVLDIVSD